MGFLRIPKRSPVHFAQDKPVAQSIFEGVGVREDTRPRKKTRRGKRKRNEEEQNEAETQGRTEDQERSLKPNLIEIHGAIAAAAASSGSARRKGETETPAKPPRNI